MEEANSVRVEEGWWLDTGATVHVCNDKSQFKTYKECTDGREVQVANGVRAKVVGTGNIDLKFSSGKVLTFVDILHVPKMTKNLVSGDRLNK